MKDDPIIRSLEQTGRPPWDSGESPRCPVCGRECETFYFDIEGVLTGCDECMTTADAREGTKDDE